MNGIAELEARLERAKAASVAAEGRLRDAETRLEVALDDDPSADLASLRRGVVEAERERDEAARDAEAIGAALARKRESLAKERAALRVEKIRSSLRRAVERNAERSDRATVLLKELVKITAEAEPENARIRTLAAQLHGPILPPSSWQGGWIQPDPEGLYDVAALAVTASDKVRDGDPSFSVEVVLHPPIKPMPRIPNFDNEEATDEDQETPVPVEAAQ